MKITNKIISTLLAVLMLFGTFGVYAFAEEAAEGPKYEYDTQKQTLEYHTGKVLTYDDKGNINVDANKNPIYLTDAEGNPVIIDTAAEKLEIMDLRLEANGHRLYIDEYSGEIAVENIASGEVMFSNPYDIGPLTAAESIKDQLMSQLVVKYTNVTSNDENVFYSYAEAAKKGQIDVKNIRNGIRVEYSIGREQSKMLVPMMIERSSFEEKILKPMAEALGEENFDYRKLEAFYILITKDGKQGDALEQELNKYPILKTYDFYILDSTTSEADKARLEQYIKTYAPDYTFDNLNEDHLLVGYESEDDNPPLFRMALEYTLTEDGLNVRLPANGIRFNETLYRLTSIDILPWMGAAANPGAGYTFFPDGSGTLFDFERIVEAGSSTTITGKVYGQDYAYHTITGKLQESLRYPVYGIVDSYDFVADTGLEYSEADYKDVETEVEKITKNRGFVAIVEEGEAMMEISTFHEVRAHKYNTVKVSVYPRPQDTYNIADAISVGQNSEWTVVSSRKYTGSYRIKYTLLTPDAVAAEKGIEDYYKCSYVGMALAYRDYLVKNGVLTQLTSEDVGEDIPLYIETFGTIPTTEKFLSIPLNVMTPLTSFEDIKQMYSDLNEKGISNINFIMTGYANGGYYSTVPYGLKWERSVGGKKGFEELLSYAKEEGFGLYPDFDFVYASSFAMFDGLTLKTHAVKTIDDRYSSKQEYSATKQTYMSFFELCISPAYMSRFYEKFTDKYLKYEPIGISVSTLGNSLNSDFDEDEPYNREDAKAFTEQAFAYLEKNFKNIMTSGGNSFTWKYVDHITDIALDSSRYSQAGAAVPFLGIVLHGFVQFAGTPINMEGNIDYAFLKAIENGSSLKFILSYRNTDELKDFVDLSQFYSIRYDIWFQDLVSLYTELNSVLADVQTSLIVDHQFVEGTRVPDADELVADAEALMKEAIEIENALVEEAKDSERIKLLNARLAITDGFENIDANKELLNGVDGVYTNLITVKGSSSDGSTIYTPRIDVLEKNITNYTDALNILNGLKAELDDLSKDPVNNADAIVSKNADIAAQQTKVNSLLATVNNFIASSYDAATLMIETFDEIEKNVKDAIAGYDYLVENSSFTAAHLADLKTRVEAIEAFYDSIKAMRQNSLDYIAETFYNAIGGRIEGVEKYEYSTDVDDDNTNTGASDADTRYQSDDDRIVYVEYENGVAFLLNFNNYTVRTVFNGTTYTIQAYDYLVLNAAK